ncbi:MAG: hypothetical protein QOI21_2513 [Actinomycetota bacterium]|nr:hypothetical protein [Actinomycetota bacterium]
MALVVILRVGFFAELKAEASPYFEGSIYDAVGAAPGQNERELIAYLEGGVRLIDIMEAESDVISGNGYISGSSSILTDGKWVWRADLAYYVQNYHLRLDNEFTRHVSELSYAVPTVSRENAISIAIDVAANVLGMNVSNEPES